MSNRQKYIAIPLGVLMSPFILAGFVFGFFYNYFKGGMYMWDEVDELITKWVQK